MKPITAETLYQFRNAHSFLFSPDGSLGAFVVQQANEEKNGYDNDLYLLEGKKVRQMTASHDVSSFLWSEEGDLLFAAARSGKEQRMQKEGIPFTAFYRLNPRGGEARFAFSVPLKVIGIQSLSQRRYLLTAVVNKEDPDWTMLEDKQREEVMEQRKKVGYYTFDELPFWSQGRGVWNGNRNALYLYDEKDGSCRRITGTHFETVSAKAFGEEIYFTGSDFTDIKPFRAGAFCYHLGDGTTTTLIAQDTANVSAVYPWGDRVLVVAAIGGTLNDTPDFYTVKRDGSDLKLLADWDSCVGHGGLVSDARGGGGQGAKLMGDRFYFLSILENDACLCCLYPDGSIKTHLTPKGSADFFDVTKERMVYGGFFDGRLVELYEDGVLLTHFNDRVKEEYSILPVEPNTFTASDGYTIHGWAIKPRDYLPGKKYPAILNIHGGPRGTYGDIFCHEMQQWANAGYFVFFCNPRGSEGRGDAFADVYGKYGTIDYDNLMDFADEMLRRYPDADPERFGVTGGSYGGYMTNWIIGHTQRFKAAVSQRSISNWLLYEFTSDIGYGFMPRHIQHTAFSDYTKTWEQSPLKYAPNAKTPTLFIHSDHDFRCWMGEGISMFNALKTLGVPSKLCLFRGESHELSRSGKPWNRIGRLNEMLGWFDRYLK